MSIFNTMTREEIRFDISEELLDAQMRESHGEDGQLLATQEFILDELVKVLINQGADLDDAIWALVDLTSDIINPLND
jgi:hypothetical protein